MKNTKSVFVVYETETMTNCAKQQVNFPAILINARRILIFLTAMSGNI